MTCRGAYAVGDLSGAAFNPAVALGGCIMGGLAWGQIWAYFFAGPINKIVIGLCVLSIAYSIFNERRQIARRRREAMV